MIGLALLWSHFHGAWPAHTIEISVCQILVYLKYNFYFIWWKVSWIIDPHLYLIWKIDYIDIQPILFIKTVETFKSDYSCVFLYPLFLIVICWSMSTHLLLIAESRKSIFWLEPSMPNKWFHTYIISVCRKNLLSLFKGSTHHIPPRSSMSNASLMVINAMYTTVRYIILLCAQFQTISLFSRQKSSSKSF